MVEKNETQSKFNLASTLTKEQKQEIEANLLKDPEARKAVKDLMQAREFALYSLKDTQDKELKRIAEEEVRKRVKPSPELRPPGTTDGRSLDERVKAVERDVAAKLAPENKKALDELTDKHHQKIDLAIAGAREAQKLGLSQGLKPKR